MPFLSDAQLYDSSSSADARVIYIHKEAGYFLKSASKGTLQREATLTAWFHKKGLAADVLAYISCDMDWMLTEEVRGDDCLAGKYLANPARLCDVLSQQLWMLQYNLKTDQYRQRFIDGYGRESVEKDLLRVVAAAEVFG